MQKYAEIMAEVSGVDVEVADATLFRVAGTGLFATGVGQDMSREGYTYRQVLASGRLQVIDRPGHEPICRDCPRCNHCEETIEIAMPILAGGQSIGVIGLVGFTQQQRQTILNARETYLGLVEQIASFMAAKAPSGSSGRSSRPCSARWSAPSTRWNRRPWCWGRMAGSPWPTRAPAVSWNSPSWRG